MPPEPVPADPGWDEDLAWLDRDPEREVWLARAREHDEPPGEDEEYGNFAPVPGNTRYRGGAPGRHSTGAGSPGTARGAAAAPLPPPPVMRPAAWS